MSRIKFIEALLAETKDCSHWGITGLVDAPKGQEQEGESKLFKKVWITQSGDDDFGFHGSIYVPIGAKYLQLWFNA